MLHKEFIERVRAELARGTAPRELWQRLREEGWSEDDINEAFLLAGEGEAIREEEKELPPRKERKKLEEEQALPPGDVHEREQHREGGTG
ncbi:hypothetical protein D6833_00075 [Candidatus Parcubacteria bacterium]|nr:MAG: hypothetical protein D6833_00075 [Candidatus Parcubacteria bacterium]